MYKDRRVSVILPTYRERDSIQQVIRDFEALRLVDEILVINNNAIEGTSEAVRPTSAREIHEPVQGYGAAIRRGFAEASGDLIVVCEPDATFAATDLHKFLAYADDMDIIYGSRTIRMFIWERANMGFLLKWGNWFVAKLLEVLFNTSYLSDVGCTYRMIRREALAKLLPTFRVNSNFFGPEMMVRGFRLKLKCVQIPVNYLERTGISSVTGNLGKSIVLGAQMTVLIIAMRFRLERWLLPLLR
ncbi:MAG: glycosyltransferase family 2 protein [Chthoniobacterales bacterium]|nr:MAG: glycosyltransferase family 2 protein [Chthoniobacterales bacterium]